MTDELRDDIIKSVVLALIIVLMCYILRGTDWEREQSVFTAINEHMSQTNE